MTERLCLVHYHEIGLKGKNRSTFENQLVTNLHRALRPFPVSSIARISGHIAVETEDRRATEELAAAIRRVPGVARVSLAYKCGLDEGEYCAAAVRALGEAGDFATFKVHARRSSTTYERHSLEMNRIVGAALCEAFPEKKVDVHTPDVTVIVHVVQGSTFVYAASAPGVGGLPVGTAGKVVTLLSSGFDSPVATWMVGRRGATCVPVHFSGRPMTSDTSEWLCQDLVDALAPAGVVGRLYVVPFGERQREISLAVPQSLRNMVRTQDRITRFLADHSRMKKERIEELMLNPTELVKDVGTLLEGEEAVREGLIDEVGGMSQALNKLHEMIRQDREKCGKIDNDSFFQK